MKITTGIKSYSSSDEKSLLNKYTEHFRNCPIPDDTILSNLGLFLDSKNLSRILFIDYIYRQIIDVQGIIIDFGTRWGQTLSLFSALRGIYEPFNRNRKIVGFDTFKGFPSVSEKDGNSDLMQVGSATVTENYLEYITKVMEYQELYNPISHIKKFEIIEGDATIEIDKYLNRNPETIVAMAFFDFDIYEPTKKCLNAIKDRLVKGSLLVFDELNDHDSPGETLALKEIFDLNNIKLRRYRYASRVSYFIME